MLRNLTEEKYLYRQNIDGEILMQMHLFTLVNAHISEGNSTIQSNPKPTKQIKYSF